jgi:hypothetical protein
MNRTGPEVVIASPAIALGTQEEQSAKSTRHENSKLSLRDFLPGAEEEGLS